MLTDHRTGAASLSVLLAGCLWGLYWVPVRELAAAGLGGPLGSLVVAGVALGFILPALVVIGGRGNRISFVGVGAHAVGGAAFMFYSVGLVEGRISSVILLFYLTPVWTTLITAFVLRWPMPRLRYAVIVVGLIGLFLVLGGNGGVPVPRGPGEWLGLTAGMLWSIASVGMRVRGEMAPVAGTTVFIAGAFVTGLLLLWLLPAAPSNSAIQFDISSLGWAVSAALVWWIASMLALVWATARLEPVRVGILLMSEVLVGVLSSALFAGEIMTVVQIAGAVLLLAAGLLDATAG